jgi:hypothetical protein
MCWPHVNPVPSGAVGKDCQRRLLSRPRFVRAVAPRIIILLRLLYEYQLIYILVCLLILFIDRYLIFFNVASETSLVIQRLMLGLLWTINWKWWWRKGRGVCKVLTQNLPGGTDQTARKLDHYSRSLEIYSNQGPLGTLSTGPLKSAFSPVLSTSVSQRVVRVPPW